MNARAYDVSDQLPDGTRIRVRAIRPADKEHLVAGFSHLSPRSVRARFLGSKRGLSDADLAYFTELDFERHVGLIAFLPPSAPEAGAGNEGGAADGGGAEEAVAVARYVGLDDETPPRRAEVAFTVVDEHQGRGIGTVLFRHLHRIALAQGVRVLVAETLAENHRMLGILDESGLPLRRVVRTGVAHVELEVEGSPGRTGPAPGD